MPAQRKALGEGRWHFCHGPMDIIVQAEGHSDAVAAAHAQAWRAFEGLLDELVADLSFLRQPLVPALNPAHLNLQGATARRMVEACLPFASGFITPMAAVAGAVAQTLVRAYDIPGVMRAWVNNGGDIAVHLAPGQRVFVGVFSDLARLDVSQLREGLRLDGRFELCAEMPVRGIATSGWRGRSFSLGIADSVTVLAATAAQADAAATVLANAVNIDSPLIERRPASQCKDDSDLGDIPVTVQVPPLPAAQARMALQNGLNLAQDLCDAGLIIAAALVCQGQLQQCWAPEMIRAQPEAGCLTEALVSA